MKTVAMTPESNLHMFDNHETQTVTDSNLTEKPKRRTRGPSRLTLDVREAIAMLCQANIGRVECWLAQIEDPARRLELFVRLLEYNIPKIARTEVTGAEGGPQEHVYKWLDNEEAEK